MTKCIDYLYPVFQKLIHVIKTRSPQFVNWLLLIILALIWGSSFILIKRGLDGFSASQMASVRISISFLIVLPFAIAQFRKTTQLQRFHIFLVGLLGSGLPPFIFAFAQTRVDSAIAGVINSTTPVFAFVLGVLFFGIVFNLPKLLGVLIGLAGASLLVLYGAETPSPETYAYTAIILLATICYGTSVNLIKRYLQNVSPLAITSLSFFFIGIPVIVYLFFTDFWQLMLSNPVSRSSFGYIAILAFLGTASANFLFFNLTQRTTALFASTVTYLIPIVAILWGFIDGEPISWVHVAGMVCILFGVYLSSGQFKLRRKLQ